MAGQPRHPVPAADPAMQPGFGAAGLEALQLALEAEIVRPPALHGQMLRAQRFAGVENVDARVAHQIGRADGDRGPVHLERSAALELCLFVQQDDFVGEIEGIAGIRSRVNHDRAFLEQKFTELRLQFLAQLVVEIDQRFVHHEHPAALGQGPGDGDTLLLAAGQFVGQAVQQRIDVQPARELTYRPRYRSRFDALGNQGGGDISKYVPVGIVHEGLVDKTHRPPPGAGAADIDAIDGQCPGRRRRETGD